MKDIFKKEDAPQPSQATQSPRELIEQWWRERVHNSPVSRDTRAYNWLYAAVEDLKRLFEE